MISINSSIYFFEYDFHSSEYWKYLGIICKSHEIITDIWVQ